MNVLTWRGGGSIIGVDPGEYYITVVDFVTLWLIRAAQWAIRGLSARR